MNEHEMFMNQAIKAGEKARLLSPPNPWVGCIIVKNGRVIAEGHTQPPGQNHAEVEALQRAGSHTKGATAYVSLEPCAHFGRTPPCTRALIQAQVSRVVIALEDPDPLVKGKGIAELQRANIDVVVGPGAKEAEYSLRAYLHHRKTGKAYCLVKTAISVDGRIAAMDGTSQWITSSEARLDAHHLRAQSQGVMVGSGTALADTPALTVRNATSVSAPPLRILLDRRGRVPAQGPLFDTTLAPTLVITSELCPKNRMNEWSQAGASIQLIHQEEPLESILSNLGSRGIIQLMVEGGAELQSSLLQQKSCQELVIYTGALILGNNGLAPFNLPIRTLREGIGLTLHDTKQLGNSLKHCYFITQEKE